MIEETEHQWECQKAACFILRTGYLGQDSWENEKKIAYALQPTRQLGLPKAQRPPRAQAGPRLGLTGQPGVAWGYSRPSCLKIVKCGAEQCVRTSTEPTAPLGHLTGQYQVGALPQICFDVTPASLNRHFLSAPHSQKALKQSHFGSIATNPQHKHEQGLKKHFEA